LQQCAARKRSYSLCSRVVTLFASPVKIDVILLEKIDGSLGLRGRTENESGQILRFLVYANELISYVR
jgi:hypothetical protein